MTKSRLRFIIFPVIVLLLILFRQFLHYVLIVKGSIKAADILLGFYEGVGFDIILGVILFIIDYYITEENRETKKISKQIFHVFLVCAVLFLALCFCPYEILNDLLEKKILYPIFSMLKASGFFDGVKNSDMKIWEGTFYMHFIIQEMVFFEWMIIYGVFQGCKLLKNLIRNRIGNVI